MYIERGREGGEIDLEAAEGAPSRELGHHVPRISLSIYLSISIYLYIYLSIYIYICICIYINRERERERSGRCTTPSRGEIDLKAAEGAPSRELGHHVETKWVQGSGFRFQGPGFRVQGPGSRVQGSGSRVQGSGFRLDLVGIPAPAYGCRQLWAEEDEQSVVENLV